MAQNTQNPNCPKALSREDTIAYLERLKFNAEAYLKPTNPDLYLGLVTAAERRHYWDTLQMMKTLWLSQQTLSQDPTSTSELAKEQTVWRDRVAVIVNSIITRMPGEASLFALDARQVTSQFCLSSSRITSSTKNSF